MQINLPLEALINAAAAALKEVPAVGAVIEFHDRQAYAEALREIFARFDTVEARLQVLENLALQPAQELYDFTFKFLASEPKEKREFIAEIIQQLPQSIARSTATARHWGAITNLDSNDFYLELLPEARPENWAGQALPHRPRWRLERELGRGGFGAVWLAAHTQLPEQEAIKFCHRESDVQFLRREFNTLKLLQTKLSSHPHIVKLKDLNLEQAPYWLAFDYVDGGTLLTVMRLRHLAWAEVLDLMQQISTGVAAAHALNIVHRDLKPANILLTGNGVAKVADFGLGKITVGTPTTHLAAGTFGYASPEQLAGEKAEPSDDVYALAVLFWQMATHTLQPVAYLQDSLAKSRLPALANTLILDCLERPRGQRPKDAAAFLARLQQLPTRLEPNPGWPAIRKFWDAILDRLPQWLKQPQQEAERKEAERKEAERKEAERKEAERKEAERKEAERKEAERKEAERKEAERKEAERKEAERKEAERKEAERKEAERKEAERKEAKAKQAFEKIQENESQALYRQFLRDYPQTNAANEAQARLQALVAAREQLQEQREREKQEQEQRERENREREQREDREAKAKQAFEKIQENESQALYRQFLRDYPQTNAANEAQARLQALVAAREQLQKQREQGQQERENRERAQQAASPSKFIWNIWKLLYALSALLSFSYLLFLLIKIWFQ